jgi:hypothetical protein
MVVVISRARELEGACVMTVRIGLHKVCRVCRRGDVTGEYSDFQNDGPLVLRLRTAHT